MRNENKQKIYALAGVMGGISFAGAYLFGSGLTIATGIPIMSATRILVITGDIRVEQLLNMIS